MIRSAIVIFIYFNLSFFISLIGRRNDIADIVWGFGFILICLERLANNFQIGIEEPIRLQCVSILVLLWALRLSIHIFLRNRGKAEDNRYQEMRKNWGRFPLLGSYLQVFMLQGTLLWIVALPILASAIKSVGSLQYWNFFGIFVWAIGLYFESIADYQLFQFKKNPQNRGKIISSGLWGLSRHPNYFGEVLLWWGISLVAIQDMSSTWAFLGPLTITILILKVSGVPLLEKAMDGRPGVEEYRKRTPVFFPKISKFHL